MIFLPVTEVVKCKSDVCEVYIGKVSCCRYPDPVV